MDRKVKSQNFGAGKGSDKRPVDIKKFNKNFDDIDWSAHKKKNVQIKSEGNNG